MIGFRAKLELKKKAASEGARKRMCEVQAAGSTLQSAHCTNQVASLSAQDVSSIISSGRIKVGQGNSREKIDTSVGVGYLRFTIPFEARM